MKKYITVLMLLCILANAFAQNDSAITKKRNYELGARSGFYFTIYSDLNYFSYVTFRKGIHEFSAGPSAAWSPFKLSGVDFSYRILPNGTGKIFDFYFQLNYFQKWKNRTYNQTIFNYPDYGDFTTDVVTYRSRASQLILEYGFDIRFLRYIYVGTSIGIGGLVDFRSYDYKTYDQFNSEQTDMSLDLIFRTSIGFRF